MKTFDVQTIEIKAPFEKAFGYIAEPENLPVDQCIQDSF